MTHPPFEIELQGLKKLNPFQDQVQILSENQIQIDIEPKAPRSEIHFDTQNGYRKKLNSIDRDQMQKTFINP